MSEHTHIVCGHCDSVVRVPSDRLTQSPRCPKCRAQLFEGKPIELKTANFDKHLTRNDLPLVVDFWAPWCGPCKIMAPNYEQATRQTEPKARFAKVNTEQEQMLGARFGIRSIPTLAVFRGGREMARQSGAMNAGMLVQWLDGALR